MNTQPRLDMTPVYDNICRRIKAQSKRVNPLEIKVDEFSRLRSEMRLSQFGRVVNINGVAVIPEEQS